MIIHHEAQSIKSFPFRRAVCARNWSANDMGCPRQMVCSSNERTQRQSRERGSFSAMLRFAQTERNQVSGARRSLPIRRRHTRLRIAISQRLHALLCRFAARWIVPVPRAELLESFLALYCVYVYFTLFYRCRSDCVEAVVLRMFVISSQP